MEGLYEILSLDNKQIIKAIRKALKNKNFGEIKINIEILPMGYLRNSEIKNTEISLIGNPSHIDILEVKHNIKRNKFKLDLEPGNLEYKDPVDPETLNNTLGIDE